MSGESLSRRTECPGVAPGAAAGSVQPGITATFTIDEWRDIRDALAFARDRLVLRSPRNFLADAVSGKIREVTGNPMD